MPFVLLCLLTFWLSVSDVRLQSNGVVGGIENPSVYFWRIDNVAGGLGGSKRVTNLKKRLVSVTLPDGKVYSFAASVNPGSWSRLQPTPDVAQVEWVPQSGTQGTLRSTDQSGNVTFSNSSGPVWLQQDDDGTQTPYNPREWELTLPSGTTLAFGPKAGGRAGQNELKWIRDRSGNRMEFSRDGIERIRSFLLVQFTHYTGKIHPRCFLVFWRSDWKRRSPTRRLCC